MKEHDIKTYGTQLVMSVLLRSLYRFYQEAGKNLKDPPVSGVTSCQDWLNQLGLGNLASFMRDSADYSENVDLTAQYLLPILREAENIASLCAKPSVFSSSSRPNRILLRNPFDILARDTEKATFFSPQQIGNQIPHPEPEENIYLPPTMELADLWKNLKHDIEEIKTSLYPDLVLMLMEKYCSFVPHDFVMADISLYQYARTSAAMAASLFNFLCDNGLGTALSRSSKLPTLPGEDEETYLLVGGDISGVQDFIYTISSSGALKHLRGRSFFLEMITEHIVRKVSDALCLSSANLVYAGGGGFFMTCQNTGKAIETISMARNNLNSWLLQEFEARLFYNIEWLPFTKKDMAANFGGIWHHLAEKIEISKHNKFPHELKKLICPTMPMNLNNSCAVCHSDHKDLQDSLPPAPAAMKVCRTCADFFRLSVPLKDPEYRYLYITDERKGYYFRIEETTYRFSNRPKADTRNYIINSWNSADWKEVQGIQLLVGNYHSGCEDLETLAERASSGKKFLGALRMDVDNLGEIFIRGIPARQRSFSRMATISRGLTLFFKCFINMICKGTSGFTQHRINIGNGDSEERPVDIIYSGGDDLFLLGPWGHVTELAFDIHEAFERYTGSNRFVTISGGITLHKPHCPVYQMAGMAKKAEDEAKGNEQDGVKKNSLAMFFNEQWKFKEAELRKQKRGKLIRQALTWPRAKTDIFDFTSQLNKDIKWNRVSRSFSYRLFEVINIWREEQVFYMPMLHYVVTRAKDELGHSAFTLLDGLTQDKMPFLAIPLTWIEYLHR